MEILATLHPENSPNDDLFPNVKKENIPSKAINLSKLSPEVIGKFPKVITSDEILPATKLKYLEIDGTTYYIPQRVDVTSNIKITSSKSDILSSPKNLLCILSDTASLAIRVVDKIEGGNEEISTLSTVLPQKLMSACCTTYNDNIYIFGGYDNNNCLNTIYKFNCITKTITKLSVTLPQGIRYACCSTYEDNIYIFGGINSSTTPINTIYKFNCTNETIETLSATLPSTLSRMCCYAYNNIIYIFGGRSNSTLNTIYAFNCTNETFRTLNVTLPQTLEYSCCSIYEDNIYIFGGLNNSGVQISAIYKFNCTSETIDTLNVTLPQALWEACCSINNYNIYIFGGNDINGSVINTIYKFNCTNESVEALSSTLPQGLSGACCSSYSNDIYIFGGYGKITNGYTNIIYNLSTSFELVANNVLIYNANSNYSFDLITDQVTIPIKNVYIGDSNNTAQLATAYLYDDSQSAWVNVNTGEVLTI